MNILGISCYFHDSAAVLLLDGVLVAAAEEERFSRKKHDFSFPENAIKFCLEKGNISGKDLDYVVLFEKPFSKFDRLIQTVLQGFPKSYEMFIQSMRTWLLDKLWIKGHIAKFLEINKDQILFSEHHISHAASTYFCSPFSESAVLTFDGVGEWCTTSIGEGTGNYLRLIKEIHFPHSIGLLYSAFTAFLGFEVNEGEYKVMGMASYGTPIYTDKIKKIVRLQTDGSYWLDPKYFSTHYSARKTYTRRFEELFGAPRNNGVPFFTHESGYSPHMEVSANDLEQTAEYNQYYADIAASIQKVTEDMIISLARHAYEITGKTSLCLAGGVALNAVANGKLLAETPFTKVYIQPSAGDGGGALGAALYAWHVALKNTDRFVMDHAYWGASFDCNDIKQSLEDFGIQGRYYDDETNLISTVVDLLVAGKVIGWFQGRGEWGPRALGNRSIIADPRTNTIKDTINEKIKFREPFRPFAPSVLAEAADQYFDLADLNQSMASNFMLMVVPVLDAKQQEIQGVCHQGTSRIQTVAKESNPRYYNLISSFGRVTGTPIILNTSFNVQGEPMVNSPTDALNTFINSGLDLLVLGDFIIDKQDLNIE